MNQVAEVIYNQSSNSYFMNIIDVSCKVATIIIAVANIYLAIVIYKNQKKDNEIQRQKERTIDLFKTIVLSPNISKMYKFFDDLWLELEKLQLKDITDNAKKMAEIEKIKKDIETKMQILFSSFRSEFIVLIDATVPLLGKKIEDISDNMRDIIIGNMFDEGINLWVDNCFNDKIKNVYDTGKKEMVKALFEYEGFEKKQ